jgi:hypothetical protein
MFSQATVVHKITDLHEITGQGVKVSMTKFGIYFHLLSPDSKFTREIMTLTEVKVNNFAFHNTVVTLNRRISREKSTESADYIASSSPSTDPKPIHNSLKQEEMM